MAFVDDGQDDDRATIWPDVPRVCFGPGAALKLNACASWVQERRDLHAYAEGYRIAAERLLASLKRSARSADLMLWPLAFLWRHYLELVLKDSIAKGRLLDGEEEGFPVTHDLVVLWSEARAHIARCGSEDGPELDHVEAAISEFAQVDPAAAGFRYPTSQQGRRSLGATAPSTVNLATLGEAMEGLANFFDAVRTELVRRLESP